MPKRMVRLFYLYAQPVGFTVTISDSYPRISMPQFTIYSAINPYGRVMQVWAKPDHMFPELIAADYPDPDTCITQLIVSTPSFSLASRCFGTQSKLLTDIVLLLPLPFM